jgi:hypothetical protein
VGLPSEAFVRLFILQAKDLRLITRMSELRGCGQTSSTAFQSRIESFAAIVRRPMQSVVAGQELWHKPEGFLIARDVL